VVQIGVERNGRRARDIEVGRGGVTEALPVSEKGDTAGPERPIAKIEVQFEVARPGVVIDVL